MNYLFLYVLLSAGLISFIFSAFGAGTAYLLYVDKALLFISSLAVLYLLLNRKVVLTNITLVLIAYIVIRIVAVGAFAMQHGYTLPGYLFPIKNWVLLLNLFIIGQSLELSEDAVQKLMLKGLFATILVSGAFEVVSSFLGSGPNENFQLVSRIPFVRYRIGIDEFITVYAYLLLSIGMIKNELTMPRYLTGVALILLSIFISQSKQTLVAIIIVSLFLIVKRYQPYLSKRKVVFTVSFIMAAAVIVSGLYLLVTNVPQDTYFSVWRRALALEFAQEKFISYPLFGYPIPSNLFGGIIPADIIHNFYGFDFDVTIFPSDVPLPFILAEEGVAGLLFVALFLYLCYRRTPEKASYVILVLLSLLGTFRMYYMLPIGSAFTYFMLGIVTRNRSAD